MLALAAGFVLVAMIGVIAYLDASHQGRPPTDIEKFLIGLMALGGVALGLVGAVLGLAGVVQRYRRRGFAVLGLVLNGLLLLGVAGLLVLGLMVGG
ncbi:MAG: hypothetical protein IRY99_09700 [Isosphaeraceae bacterium]|nr:hypothetical protein [Isosphaeraceae bacterium]